VKGSAEADLSGPICALVAELLDKHLTIAVAESLTGGLVMARLTAIPGCSDAVVGGVVAYEVALKSRILGVDPELLERRGPVDPQVAEQMAIGVRRLTGASIAVATTGEAGPESATGKPVGLFFVAVDSDAGTVVHRHQADGERPEIREAAVVAAVELARHVLARADSASG
jgi:nicotinamide-nucleotide amidase